MKTINFITDSKNKFGLGNYIRIKNLYNFFKKKNKKYKLVFTDLSQNKNFVLSDIIVFDLPKAKYSFFKLKRFFFKTHTKIFSLDHSQPWKVDYNISIFKKNIKAKKNFVSLKYVIIAPKLQKTRSNSKENKIFISIGSRDLKNIKPKLVKVFKGLFEKIYVTKRLDIKKNSAQNFNYCKNLSNCSISASNGGTTMLELLYHRKIIFVYPQNSDELSFSNYIKKKGFRILINEFSINKKLIDKLKLLKQKKLVIDNKGIHRIKKIILTNQ